MSSSRFTSSFTTSASAAAATAPAGSDLEYINRIIIATESIPISQPRAGSTTSASSSSTGVQRRMTLRQQQLEELERQRQALLAQDEEDTDEYVDRIKTVYATIKRFMNSIKNNRSLIEGHDYACEIIRGESDETIEESFSKRQNFMKYFKHSITITNLCLRVPFVPVKMMPTEIASKLIGKISKSLSELYPSSHLDYKYHQLTTILGGFPPSIDIGFRPGTGCNVSGIYFNSKGYNNLKFSNMEQSVQSCSHSSIWRANKSVHHKYGHETRYTIEWDGRTVFLSPFFENSVINWIVKNSQTHELGFSKFDGIILLKDSSGVCIPSFNDNTSQFNQKQEKSIYLNYLMDEHETMKPHREFRQRPEHKYSMCVKMIQLLEEMTENYWILGKKDIQSLEFIEGKLSELT